MKTGDGKVNEKRVEKVERHILDTLNLDEIGELIHKLYSNTGAMQVSTILLIKERAAKL